jgi:hypothetical protein
VAGWRRWAIALLVLVAGAAVIVSALRSPGGLESAGRIGALIAGLAPLVVGLIIWARRTPPVTQATSTPEQVEAAKRQLAGLVLSQWQQEIIVRQLDDPGPLAVRWRFTELDVADRAEHITGQGRLRSLIGRGRSRFSGRTDRIGEMATEFRGLARRRLVILGEPGMGKTTLAVLLLRELRHHAEPGDPVPVLLSLSGWDPGTVSMYEWLARRLAEDYPALRAPAFGPDAPDCLVTQHRILPILDGLDELPEETRPKILARLNEVAGDPLVLTCRTTQYEAAVAAPGGDVLTGGAVIEPSPLTPTDAANYLTGCLPPKTGNGWPELLAVLRGDRTSPVTQALSTPLALWLLRKVYIDTRTNPAQLCDTRRFPTTDAILEHLLDHLVDAVITTNPPQNRGDEHPFRPRHAWDPADAKGWLAFLAHHLNTIASRDLAWWQLHHAARLIPLTVGLIAGVVFGLAVGIYNLLTRGPADALAAGPVLALAFGLTVGLATRLTVRLVLGLVLGLNLLGAGVSAGLVEGEPVLGLAFGIAGIVPIVVVVVLAVRGTGFTATEVPACADLRLRGRTRLLIRKLTSWAEGRLVLRFMPGFAVGLVFGSILGLVGEVSNGLLYGLVFGSVFALAAWLAVGLIDWAETPLTNDRPQTPTITFHRDLQLVYIKTLAGGSALGVAFWMIDALTGTGGLASGLAIGLIIALAIALGVGLHQASGRYLVTVLKLCVQRRIPLRLLSFLNDAHRLGILREAGPVYQFRHAKLQDHLAQTHTTRHIA